MTDADPTLTVLEQAVLLHVAHAVLPADRRGFSIDAVEAPVAEILAAHAEVGNEAIMAAIDRLQKLGLLAPGRMDTDDDGRTRLVGLWLTGEGRQVSIRLQPHADPRVGARDPARD